MVSLKIDIQKKDLWLLSAIFVFVMGVGYVIAFNYNYPGAASSGLPAIHGHTPDELYNVSGGGGGGMEFGDWVDVTSVASGDNNVASSDGIITAKRKGVFTIRGYTALTNVNFGDNNIDNFDLKQTLGSSAGDHMSFTMPVKKGHYWKVTGATQVYWIPIISGGGSGGATYISSWQAISPGGNVAFNHGLNTDQIIVTVQFKPTLAGTIRGAHDSNYVSVGYGVGIYEISDTQVKVSGGNGALEFFKSDGSTEVFPSGYVRVLARAI